MPQSLSACMALNERRYRRNRSVRFYRHLARTGSAFPRLPRRFAPRNDNLGECRGAPALSYGLIPLYKALTERRYRRNWCVPFSRWLVRDGSAFPRLPRAQSALAMTNRWRSPLYRQPAVIASIAPGAACRPPTTPARKPRKIFRFLLPACPVPAGLP